MSHSSGRGWFDSHCHLHDEDEPLEAVDRAIEAGVSGLLLVGTDVDSSRRAIELAPRLPEPAWASIGLHPHEAKLGSASLAPLLEVIAPTTTPAQEGSVVAIGECGLDYYYEHSDRASQRQAFADQIGLANSLGLALVVHTRDAWPETIELLRGEGMPTRTVIHCFTGGIEEARLCLDLGAYLSFSGIVTFKTADDVRQAAIFCPEDRVLVETDAPFLAPVPHRGTRNEPSRVVVVGEALAMLRNTDADALAVATRANTFAVFNLAA